MTRHLLALVALLLASTSVSASAQEWTPRRYLYVQQHRTPVVVRPIVQPQPVVVRSPVVHVVRPTPSPQVHVQVVTEPTRPARDAKWRLGVGAGALLRFGSETVGTASYEVRAGLMVDQVEFGFRFDLAPGFSEQDALYTAGAGFRYRFLEDGVVHPHLGLGLESVFYNPVGEESVRAFAVTAAAGMEMDVATRFGAIAVGLDVRGHQPLAGADQASVRLLGVGAHLDLRF